MYLPPLPTDDEFRTLSHFPHNEGRHFEFKASIQCPKGKVLPTVCGFLNVGGGYMIFGVNDDRRIIGFTATSKELDRFLLFIDNMVRNSHIVKDNNETLKPSQISTRLIDLDNGRSVLIIIVDADGEHNYQLKDGVVYHRLNASNFRVTTSRYLCETQVAQMVHDSKKMVKNEYESLIVGLRKDLSDEEDRTAELSVSLASAVRDLSETNRLLVERIMRDKEVAEEQLEKRGGWLDWLMCGVF